MVQKTEIRQQLQEEAGKLVIPKREFLVTHAVWFMDLLKSLFVNPYVIVIGIVLTVF